MATAGDVVLGPAKNRSVCLFTALTATNGQPSGASAGQPTYADDNSGSAASLKGLGFRERPVEEATLVIKSTAGSGTMTGTFRLWAYHIPSAQWYPLGTGADATKGIINAGTAIGETGTDLVQHAEPVLYLGHFSRVYLECIAIGGTGTAFEAWLVTPNTLQV